MPFLYRYEAKNLQAFILQTNKLREIKGGSLLIERLNELLQGVLDTIPDGQGKPDLLNKAAGAANLTFREREAAQAFMAYWPMIVDRFVPNLQIIQAVVEVPQGEIGEGKWEELQKGLRRARNQRKAQLPEAGPQVARTNRTGLPAEMYSHTTKELQDKGLYKRNQHGSDGRGDAVGAKLDATREWASDLHQDIRAGFVSVLHIDGNDLGKHIQELSQGEGDLGDKLGQFSQDLSELTLLAAKAGYQATLEVWKSSMKESKRPFEEEVYPGRPIVLGGDDLTFLVRSDLAIPFVKAYLETFEEESEAKMGASVGKLTACAGIATTNITFPFNYSHQLAEELCSFAKKRLRHRGSNQTTPSGVAFHKVTTSMISDYETILKTELQSGASEGYLTAGPYTREELDGFLSFSAVERLAEELEGLPSSGVRETITLLASSPQKAQERWSRLGEVMQDERGGSKRKKTWSSVQSVLSQMGCNPLECRLADDALHSPLLDAWNLNRMRQRA